jgi:hypothetical protein
MPLGKVSRLMVAIGAIGALTLSAAVLAGPVHAATKVTICHATSAAGNPFVAITVDESSAYTPHLDDNGSALAGHEQDFLLPFEATANECEAAANPTPTPTPVVATPTPTPVVATPTPTPVVSTPTPTPTGSIGGGVSTATPTPETDVQGGTGTPAPSQPDTAMGAPGGSSPIPALGFGLILLASLTSLGIANLKAVRSRS